MRRKLADLAETTCSIARALAELGDTWAIMVLRDAFRGSKRFDEFASKLGIATNILSERLRQLTEAGILEKVAYSAHPPRYEYVLTRKGRDLHPIFIALTRWGDTYLATDARRPPLTYIHRACGHAGTPELVCPGCGEHVSDDVYSVPTENVPAEKARLRRLNRVDVVRAARGVAAPRRGSTETP
jgi:DNA-binding HxlR family transcriptional regulator